MPQLERAPDDDRLLSLVDAALAQPAAEREAWLRRECGGDSQLFDQVREYLESEERMGGFLLEPFCTLELFDPALEPEELLEGRFRIIREVGEGGMAVVYEAIDETLGKRRAIKCAKAGFQTRLTPEVRHATEIAHRNVCKIFDFHSAATDRGEIDFITMEFLDGPTLNERLRSGPLPEREARDIAMQLCAGLAAAHRNQVIHGDLKSNNVILTRAADGSLRAVITDFGLARGIQPQAEDAPPGGLGSAVGGAADYMAPELRNGEKPSVASDIYALGCICYEMLAGTRVRVKPLRVHPKWNRILARCLDPDPARRYPSVGDVKKALVPRSRQLMLAIAAGVVLAAVTGGLTYLKTGTPPETARLAVLPFQGDAIPTAAGLGNDVAERLSRVGRGFVVIPPGEAQRNNVDTPEKARFALAATHVLRTRLRNSSSGISVLASVIDTGTGRPLQELRGDYSGNDIPVLAKALTATVTSAFHLRLGVPSELVSAAAYPFYIQGINLLRRDQVSADEAIPFLEKAAKLDPRSALTYAGIAEADLQKFQRGYGQHWLDLAAESVAKSQSLNTDAAPVLLAAGLLQRQRGWYEEAARDFSRAVELEPNNGEAWNRLAAAYASTNRVEEAIAIYEKAVQAQPNYYAPYIDFGLFYYYRGSFKDAEKLFRRAIAIAPGLAKGHMCLGLALKGQGRLEEAEQSLLASFRLQETPQVMTDLGALYYQEERFSEAATYFRKSLYAEPPNALRYANLGDAYRHEGQLQAAAESYRRAQALAEADVAQNPREPFARARLARLFALLGDRRRAEFEIMQALAIGPGNTRVLRDAASIFETLGDRDRTLQVLGDAPRGLLEELSNQPDLRDLQKDQRFQALLRNKAAEK